MKDPIDSIGIDRSFMETALPISSGSSILVLNSSYEPINITSWKRAIVLLLKEKAQVISNTVIRLVSYIKIPISKISSGKPTKSLIYKRDNNRCQYCGSTRSLTIDHVIPKSLGGEDTWENLVVACEPCNSRKGNKLLEHTNMKLEKKPRPPYNKIQFTLNTSTFSEWKNYCYG